MNRVEPGINWIWYTSDTKEDAIAYYKEVTGREMEYDWIVCELRNGRWGFRLHR